MDLNKDIFSKDISSLRFNVDINTFNILYRKYRSFILPVSIIFACVLLFFIVVMPQIQGFLNAKDQQKVEEQKLAILKSNYNLLSNMDQATFDSNFQTLTSALPANKDFAGIINSITYNSLNSGVSVGDFQFGVGDITKPQTGAVLFPSLQLNLNLTGSPDSVVRFIAAMYKAVPLAEITSIELSKNSSIVILQFYYKAFSQNKLSDDIAISNFSAQDNALIDNISSWGTALQSNIPLNALQDLSASDSSSLDEVASSSGSPF